MIKNIISKYKAIILYLFFGGCTTIVNIAIYYICMNIIGIGNIVSNIIAWVIAVAFAYVTNKIWVFESKTETRHELLKELVNFVNCRIATGAVDLLIMYVGVDLLNYNNMLIKIIANIFVIVSNYLASKLWIFKKQS